MKVTKLRDGIEQNTQEVPAFTTKYLDEEKEDTSSEILTIRINAQERATINKLKQALHYSQDAKVLKIGLILTSNVIQGTFGWEMMDKLCDENRRRQLQEVKKDSQFS